MTTTVSRAVTGAPAPTRKGRGRGGRGGSSTISVLAVLLAAAGAIGLSGAGAHLLGAGADSTAFAAGMGPDRVTISSVCAPTHVVIDASTLTVVPAAQRAALVASVSRAVAVLDASGARLVFDGTTKHPAPARTGHGASAAVLVAFVPGGSIVASAETIGQTRSDTGFASPWHAAWVTLDADRVLADATVAGTQGGVAGVAGHELGHALGLDHAGSGEMMSAQVPVGATLSVGDRAGLAALYARCR